MINNRHYRKLHDLFNFDLSNIRSPKILEFGVSERGVSTDFFFKYCKNNNGNLYSVDTKDYSFRHNDIQWHFINSRDDNFNFIDAQIPKELDVIYLDTIHKANHIEKIFFHYYPRLKKDGFFLVDDTSWLPYLKTSEKNHFYMERNNEESFQRILEIFYPNRDNFDLEFSFVGTGLAKIRKLNKNTLNKPQKIRSRKYNFINIFRLIYNFFYE